MDQFYQVLLIPTIILFNALLVAGEYALISVRQSQLQALDSKRARLALKLLEKPTRFVAAMQVGVTMASLGLGWIGEPVMADILHSPGWMSLALSTLIAFTLITYLHVVFGEIVPKTIVLQNRLPATLWLVYPVQALVVLFMPFVWLTELTAQFTLRTLRVKRVPSQQAYTTEELKILVEGSREGGYLESDEQQMIAKVIDFGDKIVSDAMIPRPDVVAISLEHSAEEILEIMLSSPYTRYLIYEDDLDHWVGILHLRDLVSAIKENGADVDVRSLLHKPLVVPLTKDLGDMLLDFRRERVHLALVIDEYGSLDGIISLEDILEEIVGDIGDESDPDDPGSNQIHPLGQGRYRLDGSLSVEDFNARFDTEIPDENYHTVAGIVFGMIGRGPRVGDKVRIDGWHWTVSECDGARIRSLIVEKTKAPVQEETKEQSEKPL